MNDLGAEEIAALKLHASNLRLSAAFVDAAVESLLLTIALRGLEQAMRDTVESPHART